MEDAVTFDPGQPTPIGGLETAGSVSRFGTTPEKNYQKFLQQMWLKTRE
jgi:hypothetical protein